MLPPPLGHAPISGAMRALLSLGLALAVGSSLAVGADRRAVDRAVAKVKPALVRLHVVVADYQEGREIRSRAVGSGVIIDEEGYLVTNHHVAGHAVHITCTLADREEMEAELVGTDPLTDIAVVRLKPTSARKFPSVRFADSDRVRVGDPVLALGSPMALSQSVTLGIVSNTEMVMPRFFGATARMEQDGEDVGALVRWIAHDAQIYGGNSGGPLVNLRGEIVGINEIRMGLSGAIPGNLAQRAARALIRDGQVRRAWVGLELQPLFKQSPIDRGVLVAGVFPGSPAAQAGVRPGDILLRVNRHQLRVRHDEELPGVHGMLSDLPVGREAVLELWRDGSELEVKVAPTLREARRPREEELKSWGITARSLSWLSAREMKRDTTNGVLVTSVRPGGPAGEAKPPLEPGDVIVEVAGDAVDSPDGLAQLTRRLSPGPSERVPVLVTLERRDGRLATVVRLGIDEFHDPGLEATKAWLPLETQVLTREVAGPLGAAGRTGFLITRVYPNRSAEQAGLRVGDLITTVDRERLTASAPEHYEELSAWIRQYDPGSEVTLTVWRNGEELRLPVTLERTPRLQREMRKFRDPNFEIVLRDLAFEDRARARWSEGQQGVLVEEVKPGSWAELGELNVGDLLLSIDQQPIPDVATARTVLERLAADRQPHTVWLVLRSIHTRFLAFEPRWTP